jgi:hypothetical protein
MKLNTYYDLASTDGLILPRGFGGKRCPMLAILKKTYTGFDITKPSNLDTYESYLCAVSTIYHLLGQAQRAGTDTVYWYITKPADNMGSVVPAFTTFAGVKPDTAKTMIKVLEFYELIELVSPAVKGKKCAVYKPNTAYCSRVWDRYTVQHPRTVKTIYNRIMPVIEGTDGVSLPAKALASIGHFDFPSVATVERRARQISLHNTTRPDLICNGKGAVLVWDDSCTPFEAPEAPIKLLSEDVQAYKDMVAKGVWARPYGGNVDLSDRFYYGISSIPRWIRAMVRINGEPLAELDAVSLHPRILSFLFAKNTGLHAPQELIGDTHSQLALMFGTDRKTAKQTNLTYWNSAEYMHSSKHAIHLGAYLENVYPDFNEWLQGKKTETSLHHKNISKLLLSEEMRLMDSFVNKYLQGIPFIYTFDCVYVAQSVADRLKDTFSQHVEEYLTNTGHYTYAYCG